ncbi:DUF4062 domain-containing protein [Psychrobacter sp. DM4]|uniref:DUF4062 domain-containing protein n=1 Tax=Psychrobacter sp. DM4 TaxID=3440637 RepID=UPI003F506B0C
MSNYCYHIHVIRADNDQSLTLDSVAIAFQERAFLTYDVSSKLPKASLYGRQCIDACDYALIIIDDRYGTTQRTGVSQMHLSYLSAEAKLKPLLVLIKTHHQLINIEPPLTDFIRTVEKHAKYIHYYDEDTQMEQLLIRAHDEIIASQKITGSWTKTRERSPLANESTMLSPRRSSVSTRVSKDQNSCSTASTTASPSLSRPIVLTEIFSFQYTAHAYEGGNLTEVTMPIALTWLEILQALIKISPTFSSYGLQSSINRLIASKAENDVQQLMPKVHAVARCQIAQNDLNRLQRQLVAANWIELTTFGARVKQELWKLTFYAKKLSKEQQDFVSSP